MAQSLVTTSGTEQVGSVAVLTEDGAGNPTRVSSANPLPVSTTAGAPTAANVLDGYQGFTATTAVTTLITIPAGRSWIGTVTVSCAVAVAGGTATAGSARCVVATAGVGVTPAAGTIGAVEAKSGANVATGTVGSQGGASAALPMTVIAPVGNAVTITVTPTVSGTAGSVDVTATGQLI